jgi:hypothetical protein
VQEVEPEVEVRLTSSWNVQTGTFFLPLGGAHKDQKVKRSRSEAEEEKEQEQVGGVDLFLRMYDFELFCNFYAFIYYTWPTEGVF